MPTASASPQLTPPINRRVAPVEHYGTKQESSGAYNPQGVDPWGLEQNQPSSTQHRSVNQPQAVDLGLSPLLEADLQIYAE